MKIIRMTKTMAGPYGVYPVGQVRTVDDLTAAMAIGAGAAELVAHIADPATAAQPAGAESAAVDPVAETADAPTRVRRKKAGV